MDKKQLPTRNIEWWKDNKFVKELEQDYRNIISGKEKAYTIKEMNAKLDKIKEKEKKQRKI